MKRFVFVILALVSSVYLAGCGKKQTAMEESQEPISIEALSSITTQNQVVSKAEAPVVQAVPQASAKLEPLPPSGPYRPKVIEIQTALKNAGYYAGAIDGKIGPLTKKAIEEFQKANGLDVDGKVGPKTWAKLGVYLNPPAEPQPKKKR